MQLSDNAEEAMLLSDNAGEAMLRKEQEIVAVREQFEAMIQKMKTDHLFALNQGNIILDKFYCFCQL